MGLLKKIFRKKPPRNTTEIKMPCSRVSLYLQRPCYPEEAYGVETS